MKIKREIKEKIKDHLKIIGLISFIISLWVLGCIFTNLI